MRCSTKKGILTIAFDDGYQDTYNHAIKYLTKRNIKSTLSIPLFFMGKNFENRLIVGLREIKGIIQQGHEIASHTIMHRNLLSLSRTNKKAVIDEIKEPKKRLQKLLNYQVSSFVFPYIRKNQSKSLRSRVSDYYKSARITYDKPCFNRIPIKDSYSVKGFAVMKKHSLSYLNKQVDHAVKNGLWLIEVFHLVGRKNTLSAHGPKPYRFFMHIDDFRRHIDYILSKDIAILTQKEVLRKFKN